MAEFTCGGKCVGNSPEACSFKITRRSVPGFVFSCTLPIGHIGPHIACGYLRRNHNLFIWDVVQTHSCIHGTKFLKEHGEKITFWPRKIEICQ